MISFYFETDFQLEDQEQLREWIKSVIENRGCEEGDIAYIFCDDDYLHKINLQFLEHDTFTDIISFDYSLGKQLHGEIYISVDRVRENASQFKVSFLDELHRVMIHGILHYTGLSDKTSAESDAMREAENVALELRNWT